MAEETAVIEQPVEQQETESVQGESQSSPESTPKNQDNQPVEQPKLDKRTNPDALRKALKHFRENGGEFAQAVPEIEKGLGELKSYKAAIPTVREARDLMQTVNSFGGVEKIATMRESIGRYEEVDRMLEAGDPGFLDEVAEMAPQGMVKLLGPMLDKVAGIDGAATYKAIEPYALQYLTINQFPNMLNEMLSAIRDNNQDGLSNAAKKLINWYKSAQEGMTKVPSVDPERQEFESEREKFYREQFEGKLQQVFDRTLGHAEETLGKYLKAEQKKFGFSDEAYDILLKESWNALTARRNKDSVFMAALKSHVNENSRTISDSAERVVNDYTDRYADEFVKQRVTALYGKKTAANTSTNGNQVRKDPVVPPKASSAKPDFRVTAQKTGGTEAMRAYLLTGKAFDANGKQLVKKGSTWMFATAS